MRRSRFLFACLLFLVALIHRARWPEFQKATVYLDPERGRIAASFSADPALLEQRALRQATRAALQWAPFEDPTTRPHFWGRCRLERDVAALVGKDLRLGRIVRGPNYAEIEISGTPDRLHLALWSQVRRPPTPENPWGWWYEGKISLLSGGITL